MAKILGGLNGSPARGSVGALTYTRIRGSDCVRARIDPPQRNTLAQLLSQQRIIDAVARWTYTLTQAQRDAWQTLAPRAQSTDSLGQPVPLTGQTLFLRTYCQLSAAGLTTLDDPPPSLDCLEPPAITTAAASSSPQAVLLTPGATTPAGHRLQILATKNMPPGRYNLEAEWRLLTTI